MTFRKESAALRPEQALQAHLTFTPDDVRALRHALERDHRDPVPFTDEEIARMARETMHLIALILRIARNHNIQL